MCLVRGISGKAGDLTHIVDCPAGARHTTKRAQIRHTPTGIEKRMVGAIVHQIRVARHCAKLLIAAPRLVLPPRVPRFVTVLPVRRYARPPVPVMNSSPAI